MTMREPRLTINATSWVTTETQRDVERHAREARMYVFIELLVRDVMATSAPVPAREVSVVR